MADEKKRTSQDIQNEYTQACAKLGHTVYQLYAHENDKSLVLGSIKDLVLENISVQRAEQEAAAKAANAPVTEVQNG